jgi:hypothetical protein
MRNELLVRQKHVEKKKYWENWEDKALCRLHRRSPNNRIKRQGRGHLLVSGHWSGSIGAGLLVIFHDDDMSFIPPRSHKFFCYVVCTLS